MPRFLVALTATLLLAGGAATTAARAGTYHVQTCVTGAGTFANAAWAATNVAGVNEDSSCAGNTIGLGVPAGARMPNNTSAALTFTAPAGTTIADFALTRQLAFNDPVAADTHKYFALMSLGGTAFGGAGDYQDATRNALNRQGHWYGFPDGNAALAKATVTPASYPALSAYAGDASQLSLRVGCFNRGTPCSVDAGGTVNLQLHGADVTVNDPVPPEVAVEASGLLAGGARDGSDPVTVTATDSAGIRSVELLDLTDPLAPVVVGAEDYTVDRTDTSGGCDFSATAPCPQLAAETVRPAALPAGTRTVSVRVTDTGGNAVVRGPYTVFAVTPSQRGAINGVNATDAATLNTIWSKTGKSSRRTLSFGDKAGIRGRLVNANGQPITGAAVTMLTRDLRQGAELIPRGTLTTDADGRFSVTVSATASRLIQFAWKSHANDVRFGANAYLTLQARASSSLSVSSRAPRVGRSITVSGRLQGVSRGRVPVVVQGRAKGAGRYDTFADTTTSSSGRFKVRYTFRSAGSRGRSFVFRARIRPASRYPYETGYSRTVTVRVR
jgi:hypothetical protein